MIPSSSTTALTNLKDIPFDERLLESVMTDSNWQASYNPGRDEDWYDFEWNFKDQLLIEIAIPNISNPRIMALCILTFGFLPLKEWLSSPRIKCRDNKAGRWQIANHSIGLVTSYKLNRLARKKLVKMKVDFKEHEANRLRDYMDKLGGYLE